jgi:hypothetical protein
MYVQLIPRLNVVSKEKWNRNFGRIWKEAVLVYFKAVSRCILRELRKTTKPFSHDWVEGRDVEM